jgi:hypothetical protein
LKRVEDEEKWSRGWTRIRVLEFQVFWGVSGYKEVSVEEFKMKRRGSY